MLQTNEDVNKFVVKRIYETPENAIELTKNMLYALLINNDFIKQLL